MAPYSLLLLCPLVLYFLVSVGQGAPQRKVAEDGRIIFEDEFRNIVDRRLNATEKETEVDSKTEDENQSSGDIFINGQYVSDKRYSSKNKNKKPTTVPSVGPESSTKPTVNEGWVNSPKKKPIGQGSKGTGNKNKPHFQQMPDNYPGSKIATTDNEEFTTYYPIEFYPSPFPVEQSHFPVYQPTFYPQQSGWDTGLVSYFTFHPQDSALSQRQLDYVSSFGDYTSETGVNNFRGQRQIGGFRNSVDRPILFPGNGFPGNGFPSPRTTHHHRTGRKKTTPPPSPLVAASPNANCMKNCPTTPEYNPICGNDAVTYSNPGKLSCTVRCGKRVQLLYYGNCIPTTNAPINPTRDWNKG